MNVIYGIQSVFSSLLSCLSYRFCWGEFNFSFGSVLIGGLLISISLSLLIFLFNRLR